MNKYIAAATGITIILIVNNFLAYQNRGFNNTDVDVFLGLFLYALVCIICYKTVNRFVMCALDYKYREVDSAMESQQTCTTNSQQQYDEFCNRNCEGI